MFKTLKILSTNENIHSKYTIYHDRHHGHEPGFAFGKMHFFGLEVSDVKGCFTFETRVEDPGRERGS